VSACASPLSAWCPDVTVLQVSRLTTPGGGFDSRLSFGEWCRQQSESDARREFNVAVIELARSRKLVRAGVLRANGACGGQPATRIRLVTNRPSTRAELSRVVAAVLDDLSGRRHCARRLGACLGACLLCEPCSWINCAAQIKSAALRLGSRNSDMEYEAFRFEETLDAALQRRQRLQDRAASSVPRSQMSPLTVHCLQALLRLGPEEVLAGDDGAYMQQIVNDL
jgi:hypothetical protein